jgi:hypothetical protein
MWHSIQIVNVQFVFPIHKSILIIIIIIIIIIIWLYSPLLGLCRFISFLILYTVGVTPWTGDQPVSWPLPTRGTTEIQKKRIQTYMSLVGFESAIPVFEGAKTVHVLDRADMVIGLWAYIGKLIRTHYPLSKQKSNYSPDLFSRFMLFELYD